MEKGRVFRKMHGLGNDFVMVDGRVTPFRPSPEQAARIADRHKGVGCDQLIVLEPSDKASVFMRIFNADGSESAACGNATRCLAELMREEGVERPTIETLAGVLPSWQDVEGMTWVNMGPAWLEWDQVPLAEKHDTLSIEALRLPELGAPVALSMGNPHCVYLSDEVGDVPFVGWASNVETHPLFPERTNVHLVKVLDRQTLRQRVWERGVGVTLASGSGACAGAVAAMRRGLVARKVEVRLDGGSLFIEWLEDGTVAMGGAVSRAFEGVLGEELLA